MQTSNNETVCSHCHLSFDVNVMFTEKLDTKLLHFCCKGCQSVYHLLQDEGLESFYEKVGKKTLHPIDKIDDNLSKFDLDGFEKKYISKSDGLSKVSLVIEGIHCSACVWLNERVLNECDGIIETNINYTNHKASITWDPSTIKLSEIIKKIRSIGYDAHAYDSKLQEERVNKTRRDYYSRLLVGIFCTMNIMWIAIAQYAGYFTGMKSNVKDILNFAEFALATPALFYTGWYYFKGAFYGLKNRMINMDFLIISGTSLTYLYSIYASFTGNAEVYFESVTMIITFIFAGKYLEILSKKNAADSLDSLNSSVPSEVTVIRNNQRSVIDTTQVKVGDFLEVKPGDKIAIDGVLRANNASFDESSISGESVPIYKHIGDNITSGTVCLDAQIIYEASTDLSKSMLQNIITIVEESLLKKPKMEILANEISGYFSLMVLAMAILTFAGWFVMGVGFENSFIIAISVIVIACPCALGLATPVATLVGISMAAKKKILFKSSSSLETMAKATTIVLDKTGTITNGSPNVVSYEKFTSFDINLLYSLVQTSTHPVSKAICLYLEKNEESCENYFLDEIKNIEARGIRAQFKGQDLLGGNHVLFKDEKIKLSINPNNTQFIFAIDGEIACLIELNDQVKIGAKQTIEQLKHLGLELIMCTGDNDFVANKVAHEVGIQRVHSSMMPKDKALLVKELQESNKIVITVGDGINDALALSRSNVSISMGNSSDLTVKVSDVIFLNNKITTLYEAITLSKSVYTTIKQNLVFSLLYNLITISFAVLGYIIPVVAAISMSLSSLVVVGNSLRIKRIFKNG